MDEHRPTTGSLVWHLAIRWRTEVDHVVAPYGLTHAQYSVLASLRALTSQGESPSQQKLAEYTGLGPIYVSRLIRKLEQSDLVTRQPNPDDARAVLLSLTEQGIRVVTEAMSVVRALDRALTAPLGGAESDETRELGAALQTLLRETGRIRKDSE